MSDGPTEFDLALATHGVEFQYPDDEIRHGGAFDTHEAIAAFVRTLTTTGTPLEAGRKLFVIAYLMGQTGFRTHTELARHCNMNKSRVSEIMACLSRDFASLTKLRRR